LNLIDLPLTKDSTDVNKIVDDYALKTIQVRAASMLILGVVLQPLILKKSLGGLRYFSMINLMVLAYIIITTVVQAPYFYEKFGHTQDYSIELIAKKPTMNWFSGLSTILLSYFVQPNFFYVRSELIKPSKSRVTKVIFFSILTETTVYILIGVAGYVSLGDTYMVDLYALRPKISTPRLYQ